jgi:hypothetical protein
VGRIAITELIEHPDKYDGAQVVVSAWLFVAFEHRALYPTRASAGDLSSEPSPIWIDLPKDSPLANPTNGLLVEVEGVFQAGPGGHLGFFDGTIVAIRARAVSEEPLPSSPPN